MYVSTILENIANAVTVAGAVPLVRGLLLELDGVFVKVDAPENKANEPVKVKDVVTVIIDFTQRSIEEDVIRFLAAERIDSTVVVCNNPNGYVGLDLYNHTEWEDAVRGIYVTIKKFIEAGPRRGINIFISAPAALAFALGYVLRPTPNLHVYQFNLGRVKGDYDLYPLVLRVNDSLKDC